MGLQRIVVDVRLLDGTERHDIVVTTADRMKLAAVARRHKWGTLQDDPDRSITFLAWAALSRLSLYPNDFDTFVNDCETVGAPDEADEVDPTQPVTRTG